ncbi:MAG: hypothetical protein XD88_0129 [Methanocalculus sp. 52_23]|uniref:MarR family transcriptional regulator n=1 Tax=Methanocalculus sp. TaxID=2004547 RepID=UPI0007461E66|nr:helix-turn-helix domain-containing protein [Methanocalculus sp.]KUK71334.1 MAG: hypothetical protein XD88_0129 [Methanocalculus sp. 52_23]HIJ06156.1 MarR family transcriptional regulator [Methanocalculus sp.]
MTTINKKILILGYLAKVGERTVYDIAKNLGLDHAYVHRIVRQMVDEGHLDRLDPILNEKRAPAKPIRITLSGLREIFAFIMAAEESREHPYHARYTSNMEQGTATIRQIISRNLDLHAALPVYLSFFDACSDELFKPDPDEEEQYQNTRWAISLTMIVRALIPALPGEREESKKRDYQGIKWEFWREKSLDSPLKGREGDREGKSFREHEYWEQRVNKDIQTDTFGADLFFALENVVSEIREISDASGRRYNITEVFSEEIVPLFNPFEEEIAARITTYEKKGERLSQIGHRMACIDP